MSGGMQTLSSGLVHFIQTEIPASFVASDDAERCVYLANMRGVRCPDTAISSGKDSAPVVAHVVTAQ